MRSKTTKEARKWPEKIAHWLKFKSPPSFVAFKVLIIYLFFGLLVTLGLHQFLGWLMQDSAPNIYAFIGTIMAGIVPFALAEMRGAYNDSKKSKEWRKNAIICARELRDYCYFASVNLSETLNYITFTRPHNGSNLDEIEFRHLYNKYTYNITQVVTGFDLAKGKISVEAFDYCYSLLVKVRGSTHFFEMPRTTSVNQWIKSIKDMYVAMIETCMDVMIPRLNEEIIANGGDHLNPPLEFDTQAQKEYSAQRAPSEADGSQGPHSRPD